jgi:hypothetical protein
MLPPYRLQAIQDIKRRIIDMLRSTSHIYSNHEMTPNDPNYEQFACRLNIHRCLTARWKRYLACYLYERWRRIRNINWAVGRDLVAQVKQNMAPQENNALDEYQKLIQAYTRNSGIEVTTSITPPVVVYVHVEVLENLGSVQTESGSTLFLRGSRHFVRRRDIEHLIRRGDVREIPGEIKDS